MPRLAWLSSRRTIAAGILLLAGAVAALWFRSLPPKPDPTASFRQARAAITRRDFARAEQICDAFLATTPRHPQINLLRAETAAMQSKPEEALRFLAHIPDQPAAIAAEARLREGILNARLGFAARAEASLRHALALDPAKTEAEMRLREIYLLQLRRHELRALLQSRRPLRAWQLPDLLDFIVAGHIPKFLLGNWRDRVASFVHADPNDPHSAIALARYLAAGGDHAAAAQIGRQLLDRDPAHSRARAIVADALLAQGNLAEAHSVLAASPNPHSNDAPTLRVQGRIALAAEDYPLALQSLRDADTLEPGDAATIYQLGLALEKTGHSSEAATRLQCGKRLQDLFDVAQQLLGQSRDQPSAVHGRLVELGRLLLEGDLVEDAMYCFEFAAEADPKDAATRELAELARSRYAQRSESTRRIGAAKLDGVRTAPARVLSPAGTTTGKSSKLHFHDVARDAGIQFQYFTGNTGKKYLFETLGGGVCAFDYDGDGWTDLYFTQGAEFPAGSNYRDDLFRNRAGERFESVAHAAALGDTDFTLGAAAGDFDNDGFCDLVLANYGDNRTYRNNGDGTFSDDTAASGTAAAGMNTSLALADLDRDGDLDLYVVNYVAGIAACPDRNGAIYACHPSMFPAQQDRFLENTGESTFQDRTESAGFLAADGKGLGIIIADLDGDNWPDVYVANDTTPNFLFHNRGGESTGDTPHLNFRESGVPSGAALSREGKARAGMGIACADLDGNGFLDLYVTNYYLETNGLFLNHGSLWFVDSIKPRSLVADTVPLLGFGTQAVDVDLDGQIDLFVSNGHVDDYRPQDRSVQWKMPGKLYQNLGNLDFADVSSDAGAYFQNQYLGRGVARLDWNRDGLSDLAVVHQNEPVALLENATETANHRLVIELCGTASNRDSVNSRCTVTCGGRTQLVETTGGDGYLAGNERRHVVGLGSARSVDRVEVTWPSGRRDRWEAIPADSFVRCIEGRTPIVEPLRSSP